jgi:hypothetical protein
MVATLELLKGLAVSRIFERELPSDEQLQEPAISQVLDTVYHLNATTKSTWQDDSLQGALTRWYQNGWLHADVLSEHVSYVFASPLHHWYVERKLREINHTVGFYHSSDTSQTHATSRTRERSDLVASKCHLGRNIRTSFIDAHLSGIWNGPWMGRFLYSREEGLPYFTRLTCRLRRYHVRCRTLPLLLGSRKMIRLISFTRSWRKPMIFIQILASFNPPREILIAVVSWKLLMLLRLSMGSR